MARPSKDMMLVTIFIVITVVLAMVLIYDIGTDLDNDDVPPEFEAQVGFLLETDSHIKLDCQVANTTEEKQTGLMYVSQLSEDEGMLFVQDEPSNVTFWMKNVEIPLDIIFVDEDLRIINIEEASIELEGTPDNEMTRYHSDQPVLYIIEANMGFCTENGIEPGTEITITFS